MPASPAASPPASPAASSPAPSPAATTGFESILFAHPMPLEELDAATEPEHFHDLYLGQLVDVVCGARSDLEPYFWTPLRDAEEVRYRQQTLQDLDDPDVEKALSSFVDSFTAVREQQALGRSLHYQLQRQRCLLDAAAAYCRAVDDLTDALERIEPASPGMRALDRWLREYVSGEEYLALRSDRRQTSSVLDEVSYELRIHGSRIDVARPSGHEDLGDEVERLFGRFQGHAPTEDEPIRRHAMNGFGHISAQVLEHVAQLFPEAFGRLTTFAEKHDRFVALHVSRLARDAAFALAVHDLRRRLADHGLPMCFPELTAQPRLLAEGCFDAALAVRAEHPERIVRNDVRLDGGERVVVVTGPNQGGKTTFARSFGQLHYLASLGCPVPAERAEIHLPDRILVQFEREEEPGSHRGKLLDDLVRMKEVADTATADSVVVLNEVFSSTTTDDALLLAERMLDRIVDVGCLGLFVTFLDELAGRGEAVVSMVAQVDPDDTARRTFHVVRRPADGRAYAEAVAARYRLGRAEIEERIRR